MDADLTLAHDAARRNHHLKQHIEGLRAAARTLEAHLPNGKIQADVYRKMAAQARKDAVTLEEMYE